MRRLIFYMFCCIYCSATTAQQSYDRKSEFIHRALKEMTDIIVHDIFSPPVASRTYAYVSIAGYEAAINENGEYLSLQGQLHQLNNIPKPDGSKKYDFSIAAVNAILTVGKSMVISETRVETFKSALLKELREEATTDEVYANSIEFGKTIADHIMAWAAKDKYKETRSLPKYAVTDDLSSWKPTPPAYIKAIEPSWNKIRTFVIDSAQQFKPKAPPKFSVDKKSQFYKEALAVREIGTKLSRDQNEIANFWDCNPFKMNIKGHVMFATKKISPGGHWINIAALSCRKTNADFIKSLEVYARLSITLADCFISCWDEKYRSRVIRPETYINQHIDPSWMPLLQTPPFPEYTSGHSVVSSGATVILTDLFGQNFKYTDSTEIEFGLPSRNYISFDSAAKEAAISRFYGGIHYMSAINNGFREGTEIGKFILARIRTKKESGISRSGSSQP